jgi:hypothetical protein
MTEGDRPIRNAVRSAVDRFELNVAKIDIAPSPDMNWPEHARCGSRGPAPRRRILGKIARSGK